MADDIKPIPAAEAPKDAVEGEGSYSASRDYQKSVRGFVDGNKAKIDKLAHDAEDALDGPEGAALRDAEAKARAHGAPDKN